MHPNEDEDKRLRAAALRNATAIHRARQQAERDLADERERLRITLASIGDGVVSTDADGRVAFLNAVAEALTGWPQGEAAGRPVEDIFHIVNETTRRPVENPALHALKAGTTVGLANHTILIARDGTERPIEDSAAPMRDATGATVGAVLVFRDVTERRHVEAELARVTAESDRRRRVYETILSNTPDLMYVFGLDHRFTYANEALLAMWGRTWEEAIGRTCLELGYEPWHAAMHDREIEQVVATGRPIRGEVPFTGTNGRRVYDYIFVPVFGADGEVEAVAGTTRDVTEQRQAQDALRAADARAAAILESITDAFCAVDREWRFSYVNRQAEELLDRQPGDLLGKVLWDVYPGLLGSEFERAYRLAADERVASTFTAFYPDHGRWYEVYAYPATVGITIYFRNVTERVAAERERGQLVSIVETSTDLIGLAALDGRILYFNDAGLRLLELDSLEEARGKSLYEFVPDDRRTAVETEMLPALMADGRWEGEWQYRRAKTGRPISVSKKVTLIRDPRTGEPSAFATVSRDLTERLRAEEELRRSEDRYRRAAAAAALAAEANAKFRAFFEQGTNFAAVLTLDGVVVEANRLCLDACGVTRDQVIGRPFWECGWWRPSPALAEMIEAACRLAAAGEPFRTESAYFVAGGEKRVVDLNLAPVCDADGRALFVAATGYDVTDRRRMEDELRQADRKKDDFLALLAHELRNPLAPIRNGLQVLRLADDALVREQSQDVMERQLTHMVRLVDDLLDVSRINRNKMELRRSRVRLADVVASAVETARPLIDAADHRLEVVLPTEPVLLDADMTRLAQVFSNLLTNSAKYTEPGGRIRLTAELTAGRVSVSVRDTGIGIPAASLPTIFDMFSQVDRSMERTTGGLGIGLALVKGLVEMHDGTVVAQSDGAGRGSAFTVSLPVLALDDEKRADAPTEFRPAAPKRRVLVVDDNRDAANSMALMLQLLGDEVRVAHDGVEAVAAAERFHPQVVLMDVGMPRLNGHEATRRIREQPWGKEMTVVALTGWGQEGDRALSRTAGCDGHLVKPVALPDLEKLLAELNTSGGRRE